MEGLKLSGVLPSHASDLGLSNGPERRRQHHLLQAGLANGDRSSESRQARTAGHFVGCLFAHCLCSLRLWKLQ